MKTNRRRPSGSNGSGDVGEGESEGHDPVWNNASSPDSNDERNGANVDILKSNPRQTTCRGKVNTDYLKRAELHDSMDFGTKDEECTEKIRCNELLESTSFHYKIYSEIEEYGWNHLVQLGDDLAFLSFRTLDESGRVHVVEVRFDKTSSKCAPAISADIPYLPIIKWSANSRLKDIIIQFQKHLEKFQEFWSALDEIDKSLWVVGPKLPSRASGNRQINLGNDCVLSLSISAHCPRSLPECRFLGSDSIISTLRMIWSRNSKKWVKEKSFADNLACILELQLPNPPETVQRDNEAECGICYAQYLPLDDEVKATHGCGVDCACENANCSKGFHSVCLVEWLRSISTTRQSFDVLFGNCPYCSEPIAVKLNHGKDNELL